MTPFTSRWADWKPSKSAGGREPGENCRVHSADYNTPTTQRTDETDKLSEGATGQIVSLVGVTPNRPQSESGCDGEHDGTSGQAPSNTGNSLNSWDAETAAAMRWFPASDPPSAAFVLRWCDRGNRSAVRITNPSMYWQSLRIDVAWGPTGPRALYGALQDDLRLLDGLFGGEERAK